MNNTLPKRLGKEPLLDAVFECRFDSNFPASNILPGFLFSEFGDCQKLERLPHAEIPEAVRNADPNLQHIPLVCIQLQDYSFLVGDRSIAVACNMPYKGWNHFKPIVIKTINVLKRSGLVSSVLRYSTKYVDLIQSSDPADQVSLANLSLRIGSNSLSSEPYQVRMEMAVDGFVNIIQIISGAKVIRSDSSQLEGLIIDIDTIKNTDGISIEQLESELDQALDKIHLVSKQTFFDCLTQQALIQLEPEYE